MVLSLIGLASACWPAWTALREQRIRAELQQADREIERGQHWRARKRLDALSKRYPGRDEVEYKLGLCEHARNHDDDALAAWQRIPRGTPYSGRALLLRAHDSQYQGRYAEAEDFFRSAITETGPQRAEARDGLYSLLKLEGRYREVRRLLGEGWLQGVDPVETARELWRLDFDPLPIEGVRGFLDKAGRKAPNDDRIWLGRAHLAIELGQFRDADLWLSACERARPDDAAVRRTRLAYAIAVGRVDRLAAVLAQMGADDSDPAELANLRAWLARQRGDPRAEQRALEEVVKESPGDSRAVQRLADLAAREGQAEPATVWRKRKAELDQAREEYQALLNLTDPKPRSRDLARLAETLGRSFDARLWWSIETARRFGDREALAALQRAVGAPTAPRTTARTLADLLKNDLALSRRTSNPTANPVPAVAFRDDADETGLRFTFDNGRSDARQLPETMSGGVGLLDADGDGWLDVFVVQGGAFPDGVAPPDPSDRLFRNRGDGTFEDVSERAGLPGTARGYGHGVAVGDYDNDGDPDLFVTRWRAYALYRNRGDGRFEDVTASVGLGGDRDWPTSAAFGDLDGDGDLDLYVCHYLRWDAANPRLCPQERPPGNAYCTPRDFEALPDHVFRNDNGQFVDVTSEAGMLETEGRGLGVVIADLDGDGKPDVFVANDMSANFFYRNLGNFRFEEMAFRAGVACNADGGFQAGMGIACGDFDGDGQPDLIVTNFFSQSTTYFQNMGRGVFSDQTAASGLGAASRYLLGFGACAADVNNDGRLDLLTANGHVNDGRPYFPWMMPPQLLLGAEAGRLIDVSSAAGVPFQRSHLGRGLAAGDLDNDGRVDALMVAQNEPVVGLHNQTSAGHFVAIRLEGTVSNRDSVGAVVTLTAGGRRQVAQRIGGGSYQSANDPRIHFGVGAATRIQTLEVRWPSGRVDQYRDLAADAEYLVKEGAASPAKVIDRSPVARQPTRR